MCALHLIEDGTLHLKASTDVPDKLVRNLQQLSAGMARVQELEALSQNKTLILCDLAADRKPWTELLRQWYPVIMVGTIFWAGQEPTWYSHDLYAAVVSSVAGRETHSQMAAMVLERSRLQDQLRRHAYHDSLTSLPNRLLGQDCRPLFAALSETVNR